MYVWSPGIEIFAILFRLTAGNASVLSTQLYLAGTDTTSQAIKWALLYVCLYPDVQEKIRTEIQQVAGML